MIILGIFGIYMTCSQKETLLIIPEKYEYLFPQLNRKNKKLTRKVIGGIIIIFSTITIIQIIYILSTTNT